MCASALPRACTRRARVRAAQPYLPAQPVRLRVSSLIRGSQRRPGFPSRGAGALRAAPRLDLRRGKEFKNTICFAATLKNTTLSFADSIQRLFSSSPALCAKPFFLSWLFVLVGRLREAGPPQSDRRRHDTNRRTPPGPPAVEKPSVPGTRLGKSGRVPVQVSRPGDAVTRRSAAAHRPRRLGVTSP